MKIYVVTSGPWEDYGINKVFLSKEAAENYCNYWNMFEDDEDELLRIEEYNDSSKEPIEFPKYARVTLNYDGEFTSYPADSMENTSLYDGCYITSISFSIDITSCESREDIEKLARETVESKYPHWKEGKI